MTTQWKRRLCLLCALLMLAGLVPAPVSATASDIPNGAWFESDAAVMLERGMMLLNESGKFEPGRNITRAELCYALWKLAGSPQIADGAVERLTDVIPDAWWYQAVAWAKGEGIVEGYSDNSFRPNQALSRAQFAAFLCRYALRYGHTTEQEVENARRKAEPFADESLVNEIFLNSIYWARANGYINGYGDRTFRPNHPATRAHAAAILNRFLSALPQYKASSIRTAGEAYLLSGAVYPSMMQFPHTSGYSEAAQNMQMQWQTAVGERRRSLTQENAKQMRSFFEKSMCQFLRGGEGGGKNCVFSPMNVYMALAMLAECGSGETREQLLSLLGAENVETLREQANQAWNANYRDDGVVSTIFANSLWLNNAKIGAASGEKAEFQDAALNALREIYFASVYAGDASSAEYTKAFQDWLNAQTGGLLDDAVSQQRFSSDMVATLTSTLNFRAKWSSQFSKDNTRQDVFHTDSGDVTCDYMCQDRTDTFYWGENYTAVYQALASGGMWFFLPDEGVTPEELLTDSEAMDLLFSGGSTEKEKRLIVHKKIPKFDMTTTMSLIDGLKALGVTDVFNPAAADLSNLARLPVPIFVNKVDHAVRATIDEEGCTAVAFTIISMLAGSGMPPEEDVNFTLDRPFLFCVTGAQSLPLFAGIVYNPAGT